jgi:heme A synthase
MPIFLFSLPVLAAVEIFYFVLSGKSSPPVRKAALAALILVFLSVLVCSFFILVRPGAVIGPGPGRSPDSETPAVPAAPLNIALIIGMSLIFLLFMILIAVAARREQRRKTG